VFGDLADLVPAATSGARPVAQGPTQAELLASTESALAALAVSYGRLAARQRRLGGLTEEPSVRRATAARGAVRVWAYRARKAALRHVDHVPPLAWVARRYARPASKPAR
jgi:hypothetical protein